MRPGLHGARAKGLSGAAALSPDSSRGRRTREGQGLGAQGRAAARTAVRPSASLRPPRAASRGLASGASVARSPRVRRHELAMGNGAQGAGGGGPSYYPVHARDLFQAPELPPAPPPPTESLGRAWTEADVVRSDFPAAAPGRAPAPLGRRAVLESQAPEPRRPVPAGALALQLLGRRPQPAARGGQGWGARRRDPAPLYTPPPPGAARFRRPGRSSAGRASERAAGSGLGLG